MFAATFGAGQVAYSLLWFFLLFIEVWLMVTVFIDIFRSDDLRGWAKALWVVFILALPLIGILTYLVVRGDRMRAHQLRWAREQEQAFRQYVQQVAREVGRSPAEELAILADLEQRGAITPDEYRRLKVRIIGSNASEPAAA